MAYSGYVNIQGCSTVRAPLFKGTNFSYWKNAMQIFIESTDLKLWEIVNNGLYIMPKIKNDKGKTSINQKISTPAPIGKNLPKTLEPNTSSIVVWMLMSIIEFLPARQLNKYGIS